MNQSHSVDRLLTSDVKFMQMTSLRAIKACQTVISHVNNRSFIRRGALTWPQPTLNTGATLTAPCGSLHS